MLKRIVSAMVLVAAIATFSSLGCGPDRPVEPNKQPSEPEGPPKPPPPPPSPGGQNGGLQQEASNAPAPSVEQIARGVLAGEYGPELQGMLADEVATCLNKMSEENIVTITRAESGQGLVISSTGNCFVMFNIGYLADRIISGEFGSDAQAAIQRLGGTSCPRQ